MKVLWVVVFGLLISSLGFGQGNEEEEKKEKDPEVTITESIVVSGEKMGRSLEETASSVKVVSSQDIQDRTFKDLYDVVARTANVGQSFGELGFNIRGIDQRGFGGSSNPTLSVFVDGGILNNVETFFGPFSMWDMEQVEIFRGPQSTTQGRNSLAGAIILRSQKPTNDWDLKLRTLGGQSSTRQYATAFGGPIIDDVLSFRVSGERREHDGYITNTLLNADADAHESDLYRLKFLLTPRNVENLNILMSITDSDSFGGEDSLPAVNSFAREVNYDTAGTEGVDMQIYSLDINYGLSEQWELALQLSNTESEHLRIEDIDNTPLNLGVLDVIDNNENQTQELRFTYKGDNFRAMFGLYNTTNKTDGFFTATVPLAFLDPNLPPNIFVARQSSNIEEVDNQALFGEVDWELSEKWTLTAGARFDQEDRSLALRNQTQALQPLPPPLDQLLAPFLEADNNFSDTDLDAFLPKVAVTYNYSDRTTTGLSFSKAYRSGGSGNSLSGLNFFFDPEFTTNYEWFVRSRSADNRWTTNFNLFYVDWEDQQVRVQAPTGLPNDTITVNAGTSRLQGFELETAYQIMTGLEWYLSIGHSDTEFTEFIQDGVDLSGDQFPFAAEWSGATGLSYRNLRGIFGTMDVTYTDDRFANVPNLSNAVVDDHTLVNLKLGWENDNWSFAVEGRNLLDKDYYTSFIGDINFSRTGAPRVVSVVVDYTF